MVSCGLIAEAKRLLDVYLTHDRGLHALAAADILRLLATGASRDALAAYFQERTQDLPREMVPAHLQRAIRDLDPLLRCATLIVSEEENWGNGTRRPFADELTALAAGLAADGSAPLLRRHLQHKAHWGQDTWSPEEVKALLAIKLAPLYGAAVLHFVSRIETHIRPLCEIELIGKIPPDVAVHNFAVLKEGVWAGLRAFASLRLAAVEANQDRRQAQLDEAITHATEALNELTAAPRWADGADEFTLDVLIEFVRELHLLDPGRGQDFARSLVRTFLASSNADRAHRLFELATYGYSFTTSEHEAIEAGFRSSLEYYQRADSHASAAAAFLTDLASAVLMVDVEHGMELLGEAAHHTARIPA
jgi:hypothetical protein